eukprot:CAMPEP_0113316640 /NCGR_PEP_ID=MMETSP0010_2-20120614/11842_1 /TAXON_ID=216773 ORGANISM="Corethron hystrix, Strain 308" /NCGR_SAMPLE_ID=MMETSP0010_2 /ASSEMBLY_ACC=CAM_ASM_000155 /LENGTH=168 /DNA_ID=CAMNT_0000173411 /DNA_START=141 /DNA_END=647 /DNA_ORIENTATION=+ /assembly_acc=CAM_ASM_000155
MSTVIPGTKEDTKTDTKRKSGRGWERKKTGGDIKKSDRPFKWSRGGPLEYLMDAMASRNDEDPYHILLLDKTFEEPRITVDYVSSSLTYVLGIPSAEADELTEAADQNGMSCLGTWPHEECLALGEKLRIRDIVCRIVPFVEGGARGWQAKAGDALNGFGNNLFSEGV